MLSGDNPRGALPLLHNAPLLKSNYEEKYCREPPFKADSGEMDGVMDWVSKDKELRTSH
jgi:hypothetical protein